jgi:hypothetical protein
VRFLLAAILAAPLSNAGIHVNLYPEIEVSRSTLDDSLREAGRILATAKVRLTWSLCRPADSAATPCAAPGPSTLQVRLYGAEAESRFPVAADAFGFALAHPAPEFGFFAGIFFDRAQRLASHAASNPARLVGHVIAHEIGHLLLGGGGHAGDGIMRFPWHARELDRMNRGSLAFLPQQVKAIRQNVEARQAQALKRVTSETTR